MVIATPTRAGVDRVVTELERARAENERLEARLASTTAELEAQRAATLAALRENDELRSTCLGYRLISERVLGYLRNVDEWLLDFRAKHQEAFEGSQAGLRDSIDEVAEQVALMPVVPSRAPSAPPVKRPVSCIGGES